MTDTSGLSATPRTTLRRLARLGSTDRADLYAILDAALVCHLGVIVDGHPVVVPTGYGRDGDTLYLHGSVAARSLTAAHRGSASICVTLLDGVVYARSIFNQTVNYRSAIIFAAGRLVDDPAEKEHGLRVLTEHLAPGQWEYARRPTRKELAATSVVAVALTEASVKLRQGPPGDDEEDHALPIWAGVLPLRTGWGEPVPCPRLEPGVPAPPHVADRSIGSV